MVIIPIVAHVLLAVAGLLRDRTALIGAARRPHPERAQQPA